MLLLTQKYAIAETLTRCAEGSQVLSIHDQLSLLFSLFLTNVKINRSSKQNYATWQINV